MNPSITSSHPCGGPRAFQVSMTSPGAGGTPRNFAHAGVAKKGIDYKISPQAKAALNTFVAEVPKLSPVAYQIQGYKLNRAIFNPTVARLGQAIAGEMSLDDALKRISADIDEQVKAAAK